MSVGSTTTTPSISKPFTKLTGTTVNVASSALAPARPNFTPFDSSDDESASTKLSGHTMPTRPVASSVTSVRASLATAANNCSRDVLMMRGSASPSRTAVGGVCCGAAVGSSRAANSIIWRGMRYPTDNSATVASRFLGSSASTSLQSWGANGPVAWAISPTTVIAPLSDRRPTMRNCRGVKSCTSSTTMWP